MPSRSAKQHRTMQAAAHSKSFSRKVGISQKVAKEFTEADKRAGKYQGRRKCRPNRLKGKRG